VQYFLYRGLRGGLTLAVVALAASCSADSFPGRPSETSEPTLAATSSSAAVPADLRAAYIAAVQRGASANYAVIATEPGRMRAENEAQRFRTNLDRSGVLVLPNEQPWSLSVRTTGLGCEGAVSALSEAEPEAEGNRVWYQHDGVNAWYVNGPLGLEQGFVVAQAPSCAGVKVVTIELGGDLRAALDDADGDGRGEALRLLDSQGRAVLAYTDLFVKDAQGKALSAWLSVEAGRVSIHVDDAGAAYPVEIDPLFAMQQAKLVADDGSAGSGFGFSVALSGDTALVGASVDDALGLNAGAAYVFVRSGGVWAQQAKLLASDGAEGDLLGRGVSLSGDTALVSSPGDDDNGNGAGAAYVFVRSAGAWTQEAKLVASDGAAALQFGGSVALSGDTALVGSDYEDDNPGSTGSA
jgi:hypothetical protein